MVSGSIALDTIDGPFDLTLTLESGQSYLWERSDGAAYAVDEPRADDAWYWTGYDGDVLRIRQREGRIEWEGTSDLEATLVRRLGLEDDLDQIRAATNGDQLVADAFETYPGLRIVRDPFFPCLVSFICSTQMRVARIFEMQRSLREHYGEEIAFAGETYRAFPTPERLAETTESELRAIGLGYRAPYVRETAEMVASGSSTKSRLAEMAYEDAREALTDFVGVGPKVADCVLLFSLGFLEAVPLDTWIQTAIEEYYPHCSKDSYAETSRAIRQQFGGEYAGYAQTYVFHHLRTGP